MDSSSLYHCWKGISAVFLQETSRLHAETSTARGSGSSVLTAVSNRVKQSPGMTLAVSKRYLLKDLSMAWKSTVRFCVSMSDSRTGNLVCLSMPIHTRVDLSSLSSTLSAYELRDFSLAEEVRVGSNLLHQSGSGSVSEDEE